MTTRAFVDDLLQQQKEIDEKTRAMAKDIVDAQDLKTLEEAKQFAQSWIESAAQDEEYFRNELAAERTRVVALATSLRQAATHNETAAEMMLEECLIEEEEDYDDEMRYVREWRLLADASTQAQLASCKDLRHVCGGCGFQWPERSAYDALVLENAKLREELKQAINAGCMYYCAEHGHEQTEPCPECAEKS